MKHKFGLTKIVITAMIMLSTCSCATVKDLFTQRFNSKEAINTDLKPPEQAQEKQATKTNPVKATEKASPAKATEQASPAKATEKTDPVKAAEQTSPTKATEKTPVKATEQTSPTKATEKTDPIEAAETEASESEKPQASLETKNPKFYTLIDASLKPEDNEFYVKSIYQVRGEPKALIARSNNSRSDAMFTFPIEFRIGDKLTDNLIIKDIILRPGKIIKVLDINENKMYALKISYGQAKSRLILSEEDKKKTKETSDF